MGLGAVPSVIMFFGFVFLLPESPRYKLQKGQEIQAKEILQKIRADDYEEAEFDSLKEELANNQEVGLVENMKSKVFRRALFVGCGLQLFQQLGGINTVMYYSASIMEMSGIRDPALAIWMAAVTSFVNFSFTFVGMFCVERLGRRKLTIFSQLGVVVTLFLLSAGFFVSDHNSDLIQTDLNPYQDEFDCYQYETCSSCQLNKNCGYCYFEGEEFKNYCFAINQTASEEGEKQSLDGICVEGSQKEADIWWTDTYCPSKYSWMSLVGMILYLMCFAPGMGTMPWTLNAEIYPQSGRSLGNSLATTTNWVTNFIVSLTFLSITEAFTTQGAFLFYSVLSAFGLIFFFYFVPETKGLPLEKVPELFETGQKQISTSGCSVTVKTVDQYDALEK